MVGTPIPNLHGTPTHRTAVELYQKHYGGAAELCARCGERVMCPTRRHAASVIVAAGEDPGWYDGRLSTRAPDPRQRGPDERPTAQLDLRQIYPDHVGYAVGGRSVPSDPAGFLYEREREP